MIESVDNSRIKEIRKLKEKKYRDQEKLFLVEGEHLVLEAYKSKLLKTVILCNRDIDLDVEKIEVSEKVMNTISDMPSKVDIVGVCEIVDNKIELDSNVLILDGVQDPGNLGTIVRSAVAFNIKNIVLSKNTVDIYNPKVLMATQGMYCHIPIISVDASKAIMFLKNNHYAIYGTNVVNGVDARTLSKEEKEKFCLIVGNEGKGVRKEIQDMCDKNLYIPMRSEVESLNVGVACSILLYELER